VGHLHQRYRPTKIQGSRYSQEAAKISSSSQCKVQFRNHRSRIMQDNTNFSVPSAKRIPWNKGKLIGAKPPLRQKHVWAIIEKRTGDLAMFNLAIDSKLRGCDVVAMKVQDVAPNGHSLDRATVGAQTKLS
jgi:hypothetical protein